MKKTNYKGTSTIDVALVYAPYIPDDNWIKLADKDEATGWNVYNVTKIMRDWIESHPREQWRTGTYYKTFKCTSIAMSPELEVWFLLRWS